MAIKKVKPTTPGRRGASFQDFSNLSKGKPEKGLMKAKKNKAGRNSSGKITVRHRGAGVKRAIRQIDWTRDKFDIPGKVKSLEYDPNRGARIALVVYKDGEKRYMLAPTGLAVGDEVVSSRKQVEIETGNALPLKYIPAGVAIHNVELVPGGGGKLARGAGNALYVMGIEKKFAQVKMPSGEIRFINKECLCTVGQVGNVDKRHVKLGKAGRKRKMGFRPTVRGSAMNPVDHPHGGGEGNQPIGLPFPKTPWGKNAFGVKTRKKNRPSDHLIIKRRKSKNKKK